MGRRHCKICLCGYDAVSYAIEVSTLILEFSKTINFAGNGARSKRDKEESRDESG